MQNGYQAQRLGQPTPGNISTSFEGDVFVTGNVQFTPGSSLAEVVLGGTAPAVTAAAGAGTDAAVSAVAGLGPAGSFVLTTGSDAEAGVVADVAFGAALSVVPVSVLVSAVDTTSGLAVAAGASSVTASGFSVSLGSVTATDAYAVSFLAVTAP